MPRSRRGRETIPPADSVFTTSDDTAAPGGKSRIGAITAKGVVDSLTHFESVTLPKIAHLPGKIMTSQDAHCPVALTGRRRADAA